MVGYYYKKKNVLRFCRITTSVLILRSRLCQTNPSYWFSWKKSNKSAEIINREFNDMYLYIICIKCWENTVFRMLSTLLHAARSRRFAECYSQYNIRAMRTMRSLRQLIIINIIIIMYTNNNNNYMCINILRP